MKNYEYIINVLKLSQLFADDQEAWVDKHVGYKRFGLLYTLSNGCIGAVFNVPLKSY